MARALRNRSKFFKIGNLSAKTQIKILYQNGEFKVQYSITPKDASNRMDLLLHDIFDHFPNVSGANDYEDELLALGASAWISGRVRSFYHLGNISQIEHKNIRRCPIKFPSKDIIREMGTPEIVISKKETRRKNAIRWCHLGYRMAELRYKCSPALVYSSMIKLADKMAFYQNRNYPKVITIEVEKNKAEIVKVEEPTLLNHGWVLDVLKARGSI